MNDIVEFQGEHRFLSNFWPCEIWFEGVRFSCVETAYVAAKTTDFNERFKIATMTAGEAKRYGRTLKLRKGWDTIKLSVMEILLLEKFKRGSELSLKLLWTNPSILIEGNTWGDTYWGVCKGVGENNLGKLLMKIREELLS